MLYTSSQAIRAQGGGSLPDTRPLLEQSLGGLFPSSLDHVLGSGVESSMGLAWNKLTPVSQGQLKVKETLLHESDGTRGIPAHPQTHPIHLLLEKEVLNDQSSLDRPGEAIASGRTWYLLSVAARAHCWGFPVAPAFPCQELSLFLMEVPHSFILSVKISHSLHQPS